MRISILTFDAFNDLDSLVAFGMLNRIALLGDKDWQVRIASPTPRVTSMNGLTIDAHEDLGQLAQADAVRGAARAAGLQCWLARLAGGRAAVNWGASRMCV